MVFWMNGVFDIEVLIPSYDVDFKVRRSKIRMWIHERDLDYNVGPLQYVEACDSYRCTYTLYDRDAALQFKLTFGGK
jgi:hypothetical protein